MTILARVNQQLLNPHERRRRHRVCGGLLPLCGDILRSMAYWRSSRRSRPEQYQIHRSVATQGYPLARLRMVEAAIRCDLAARDAVEVWRRV
jgi:hypothetical protein